MVREKQDRTRVNYLKAYRKYGLNPKSLRWKSKKAADLRYFELTKDIDFEGKRVLDVGCGFGDLIPFISKKAKNFTYTGVDLMPEFIAVCRQRFKDNEFIQRDYYSNPLKKRFDIVLTSGTLNSNSKDALGFRKKAIRVMFEKAKEVTAFNMAGGHPRPVNRFKKGSIYYADSLSILKFCLSLTSKIVFRHHYRKQDFTVVMYK
jgi:ubiquinone/menaquinone biosynthesis C-methylase UbiE